MSMTMTDARRLGAEAELNVLLAAQGRPPGTWTGDELAAAYQRAAAGKSDSANEASLDRALNTALAMLDTSSAIVTRTISVLVHGSCSRTAATTGT